MRKVRVIIMGAGGRDFHNFNVYFRGNDRYEVVAFTAAQIPEIEGRHYPPELAGPGYPEGIPIYAEEELVSLIQRFAVDEVVFAYSDVSHEYVMHRASVAMSAGASFRLLGPKETMLKARVPVVSVGAVRTGSGKSPVARRVGLLLQEPGWKVVVIRHPMAYGDLLRQVCQRFASVDDLDRYAVTIEEREEYEPHVQRGLVVYAGVDYEQVVRAAEAEAEVILWDGGNNDFPFLVPDLHIVIVDPHRAGHELTYHPGETNLRMANVVVINKVDTAPLNAVEQVRRNVQSVNPVATIVETSSPIAVDRPEWIEGRRVLVVEDGPTLTHGGMAYGAGTIAAQRHKAKELVDPRPFAVGSIQEVYRMYPHLGPVLPAMGYSARQIHELAETISRSDAEVVVVSTPVDLRRVIRLDRPSVRVTYEIEERSKPDLREILTVWTEKVKGEKG